MKFTRDNKELRELAEQVMQEFDLLSTLNRHKEDIRIGYQWSESDKMKDGMVVYGDCEKVKPKLKEFIDYDFIITFYPCAKNISERARKMLMYHELRHIGINEVEGNIATLHLNPHTIQDFREIVEKFGFDWEQTLK